MGVPLKFALGIAFTTFEVHLLSLLTCVIKEVFFNVLDLAATNFSGATKVFYCRGILKHYSVGSEVCAIK